VLPVNDCSSVNYTPGRPTNEGCLSYEHSIEPRQEISAKNYK